MTRDKTKGTAKAARRARRGTRQALAPPRLPVRRSALAAATRVPKKTAAVSKPASGKLPGIRTAAGKAGAATPAERSAEPDRAELQRQLAAAELRIRELETRLAAVADRIAWIADSLHSLLENKE